MAKITFLDKVATRQSILPRVNSVIADDLNEIKNSVNFIYDNPVVDLNIGNSNMIITDNVRKVVMPGPLSTDQLQFRDSTDARSLLAINGEGHLLVNSNVTTRRMVVGSGNIEAGHVSYSDIVVVGINNNNSGNKNIIFGVDNVGSPLPGSQTTRLIVGYNNVGGEITFGLNNSSQAGMTIGKNNTSVGLKSPHIFGTYSGTETTGNGYPNKSNYIIGDYIKIPNSINTGNSILLGTRTSNGGPYATIHENNLLIGTTLTWSAGYDMAARGVFYTKTDVAPTTLVADTFGMYSADRGGVVGKASPHFMCEDGSRIVLGDLTGFGTITPQAKVDIHAQGPLSTDVAFRVRNSADTKDILTVLGDGQVYSSGKSTGTGNTVFGEAAGANATTGNNNTIYGVAASGLGNGGFSNCVFGVNTYLNGTGWKNVIIGQAAAQNATSTVNSVVIGHQAGANQTTGDSNTFIGYQAGYNCTVAADNIVIGNIAGVGLIGGGTNIFIGHSADPINAHRNTIIGGGVIVGLANVNNQAILADGAGIRAISKDTNNNVFLGDDTALATTATNGFQYCRGGAGIPTGVPATSITGHVPMYVDSTNNKMYIYSGGAWVALN